MEDNMDYNLNSKYELSSKQCPDCKSPVLGRIVRNLDGEFYKYRGLKCSKCKWGNL